MSPDAGTLPLQIGKVQVGGSHRVALQTMTTTDTRNVQATVDQVPAVSTRAQHRPM
jgi:4-hydroxy-3-methylbut-2-en-1-yl diphosphate synthase IspG/GcpE